MLWRIQGDNVPLSNRRLPLAEDLQEEVLKDLEEKLLLSSRPLLPYPQGGRWEPIKLLKGIVHLQIQWKARLQMWL